MSDLIKREDAMSAVQDHFNANGFKGYDDGQKMMDRIKAISSAETHDKRTETHGVCLISKEDAIEAIVNTFCKPCKEQGDDYNEAKCRACNFDDALLEIRDVPSVQSQGELISRENAIKAIDTMICDNKWVCECAINSLPSSEAGWIPCSERLPSVSDNYLCTIPLDADETYTEVLTFHKGRFYEDDDEWGATCHDDVIAWIPLPKPYKESEA